MAISIADMSDSQFSGFLDETKRATEQLTEQLEDFGIDGTAREGVVRPSNRQTRPYHVLNAD